MKKRLVFFLIMLVAASLTLNAYAEYSDEIVFRGFSWRTSMEFVSPLYPRFEEKICDYYA